MRGASCALAVVALVASLLCLNSAGASQAQASTAGFVTLAKHGLSGTYAEVYQVTGPFSGTVEVFQEASPHTFPFPTGHGMWSFLFQAQTGISSQWIERGTTAWDCWRAPSSGAWSCSGPGHFENSNGFGLGIEPYIPGVVISDIDELELGLKEKAPEVKNPVVSESTNSQFGPLQCLRVAGITTCIDRSGVLVSQQGGSYWSSITLLRRSSSVPTAAFRLVGSSSSAGKHFVLPPE